MEIFETLAECSIALAGFGAVHAVLQGSTGPRGAVRAFMVVSHGVVAFILALIPLLLDIATITAIGSWRIASVFGLVSAGTLLGTLTILDIRLCGLGFPAQAPLNKTIAQFVMGASVLAMLANLVGWPWPSGPMLYATGVVLILIASVMALVHSFIVPIELAMKGKKAVPNDGQSSNK